MNPRHAVKRGASKLQWFLAVGAVLIGLAYIGRPAMPASAEPQPGLFNPSATIDTGQVQDRRPMAPCTHEDGSGSAQIFPCVFLAADRGNGMGHSFILLDATADPIYIS